jgi:Na+-translocating ferredoxin:NAD+ oxidoreductase RnfD subunit
MFIVILAVVSGMLGTILALHLMALDAQEVPSKLTVRGRIVVGLLCGVAVAIIVSLLNGMWWDCDLRAGSTSACRLYWSI